MKSGFFIVGHILLAIATFILLLSGFFVIRAQRFFDEGSWLHGRPLWFGIVLIGISTVILVLTMDRWYKALPGFFALGVFNGLLVLVSGHALSRPSVPVPRLDALLQTMAMLAITLLSMKIASRRLSLMARLCIICFYFGLAWSITSIFAPTGIRTGMAIAVGSLLVPVIWYELNGKSRNV